MNILAIPLLLSLVAGDNTGTAALPLLKIGQGPRAAAMGESYIGLADDASAIYWNPAGLGQLHFYQLSLSHHQWFADITDEVAHAALPAGPGAVGLGVVYSGEPDVRYWDIDRQDFANYRAWKALVTAGYGLRVLPRYQLGIGVKGLFEALKDDQGRDENGVGAGIDVGAVGRPFRDLGIGVVARHLGMMKYGDASEPLPAEVAAGLTYGIGPVRATVDGVLPLADNDPNFRAGLEFSPVSLLALRVGYRTGPLDLKKLGPMSGLTAGVGVALAGIGVDYAYAPYGELGATHRVGIRTVPPPDVANLIIVVLDDETKVRVDASVSITGVTDTTTVASEVRLEKIDPGEVLVRASADGYKPKTEAFRAVSGRTHRDTVYLSRLRANLRGGIYDAKTKQPIGGTLTHRGPVSGQIAVAAMPGTFALENALSGTYVLEAAGPTPEYLPQTCTLELPPGQTVERNFYLWRKGDFLVLEGVNFETGKADILPQFYTILDQAGEILKQTPDIRLVELAGHTDPRDISTSIFPSNWELSDARAKAVRQYLIVRWGIAPERLTTRGYADTQPVAPNTTFEGMAKNRRTELRITE